MAEPQVITISLLFERLVGVPPKRRPGILEIESVLKDVYLPEIQRQMRKMFERENALLKLLEKK